MKRIVLVFAVVIGIGQYAYSQQDPKFTHYMFNQVVYNPAFIGVENGDNFCLNFVQHNQWLGFETDDGSIAPITTTFNFHRPFVFGKHKVGIGLIVNNDRLGFMNDTWGYLGGSYIYEMGTKKDPKTLSGGINLGIIQKTIDPDFRSPRPDDPRIQALMAQASDVVFDFGAGLLYKTKDYYVGVSTLHIPQNQFEWYEAIENDTNRIGRHLYINGGYELPLSNNLVLQPRTLLKWDRAKFQWDIGALAEINQTFWGGLNVRGGEGVMFLLGYKKVNPKNMQGWKAGISYDLTFNQLRTVSNGTFELMFNYCFPLNIEPKDPDPDLIPRFLGGYTR